MSLSEHMIEEIHPIDIVETLAEHHDWDFDRVGEDQIAMAVEGSGAPIRSPWPGQAMTKPCA